MGTDDEAKVEESPVVENTSIFEDGRISRVPQAPLLSAGRGPGASQRRMVPMSSTRGIQQNVLEEKKAIAGRSFRRMSFRNIRKGASQRKTKFTRQPSIAEVSSQGVAEAPSVHPRSTRDSRQAILREKQAIAGRSNRVLSSRGSAMSSRSLGNDGSQRSTANILPRQASIPEEQTVEGDGVRKTNRTTEEEKQEEQQVAGEGREVSSRVDPKRLGYASSVGPPTSPEVAFHRRVNQEVDTFASPQVQQKERQEIDGVGSFAVVPVSDDAEVVSLDEEDIVNTNDGGRYVVTSRRDGAVTASITSVTRSSMTASTVKNFPLEAELVESQGDLYAKLREELRKESVVDAVAVPAESDSEIKSRLSKRKRSLSCVMFLLLLLGMGLGLGLGLNLSSDQPIEEPVEPKPNQTDKELRTPSPSLAPTFDLPTQAPSSAPTPLLCEGGFIELVGVDSNNYRDVVDEFTVRLEEAIGENTTDWNFCDPASLAIWVLATRVQFSPNSTTEELVERYALTTLYLSLGGDTWGTDMNWLDEVETCDMDLYTCGRNNLNDLQLIRQDLKGTIPSQIGLLTGLADLSMSSNSNLEGTIPSEIGLLTKLQYLDLSQCALTGSLPSNLGFLTQLVLLNLNGNELSGQLPSEMGLLTVLTEINMDRNSLTGLPVELFNAHRLEDLLLSFNKISGELHTELGLLTRLQSLDMEGNLLVGSLPSEIGLMKDLISLNLKDNNVTSTLPTEIGTMSRLVDLIMISNKLNGTIPSEIGLMESLQSLLLNRNELSGSLPTDLGNCDRLTELNLSFNQLAGPLPSEMGKLSWLESVSLNNCDFNGTIPAEMSGLDQMTGLDITSNSISGGIDVFVNFTNLETLFMKRNRFKGTIPTTIGNLDRLGVWDATYNRLSGSIPSEISGMVDLFQADFSFNKLNSSLPSEIANLPLERFLVTRNNLSGTIPAELWEMTSLVDLRLNSNAFTGSIATEVGLCTNLLSMILKSNRLTGTLPSELGHLTSLIVADFSANGLITGTVPEDLADSIGLESLVLCNTSLTGTVSDVLCEIGSSILVDATIECECCDSCGGSEAPQGGGLR